MSDYPGWSDDMLTQEWKDASIKCQIKSEKKDPLRPHHAPVTPIENVVICDFC